MVSRRLLVLAVALMMDFTAPVAAEGFVEDRRLFNHRQLFNERRGLFMKKLKKTGKKVFGGGAKKPKLPVKPPKLPVEPPKLPVEPPKLPVEPPKLPVEPPNDTDQAGDISVGFLDAPEPPVERPCMRCMAVSLECKLMCQDKTPEEFCAKSPENRYCFEPYCNRAASYCKSLKAETAEKFKLPVEPPTDTVKPPKLPVEPPKLPVEPPKLPVEPPKLPVEPPKLPVEPPKLPVEPAPTLNTSIPILQEPNKSKLRGSPMKAPLTNENNSDDAQSKILIIASAGTATVVIASVLIALAIRRKMTGSKTEVKNPVQSPEKIENHPVKEKTSPITKYFDKTSGRWYEHNSETKATRWLTPEPVEQTV